MCRECSIARVVAGGGLPAGVSPAVSGGSAGGAGGGLPAGVSPAVSGGSGVVLVVRLPAGVSPAVSGGRRWCWWWVAGRGESGGVGSVGRSGGSAGGGAVPAGWFAESGPCASRLHDAPRPQPRRCTAAGRTSSDCTCRAAWFAVRRCRRALLVGLRLRAAAGFAGPGAAGLCWWASACAAAAGFAGPGADGLRHWRQYRPPPASAPGPVPSPLLRRCSALGSSGFGGGPPSGPPGMPFTGPRSKGAPPPSFGPGEWMHHADAGLGPGGAGAVPPAAPIAPQVAQTPVSPQTAPTAGSGDWHSPIPAEQPSAPQAPSTSYSSQAASPMMSTPSATNAGYAVHIRAVGCVAGLRLGLAAPGWLSAGRVAHSASASGELIACTRITNNQPRGRLWRGGEYRSGASCAHICCTTTGADRHRRQSCCGQRGRGCGGRDFGRRDSTKPVAAHR